MEQYGLYLWLRETFKGIAQKPKISFNDMDANGDDVVGIYIKGDAPVIRTIGDMKYCNLNSRVEFSAVCSLDKSSYMGMFQAFSKLKKVLTETANETFMLDANIVGMNHDNDVVIAQDDAGGLSPAYLTVIRVDALSDVLNIGKQSQGKPRLSLNLRIIYSLGGE